MIVVNTKTLFCFAVGMTMLLSHSAAYSDADFARIPKAVTQIYDNDDTSRLDCRLGGRIKTSPPCYLIITEGKRRIRASFDPLQYGYSWITQEYYIFGTLQRGFAFTLKVECNDEDMKLIHVSADDEDYMTCSLYYDLRGDQLIPMRTTIAYDKGGKSIRTSREFKGNSANVR